MGIRAIVVHGGGINPLTDEFNEGVREAALRGYEILKEGGLALDAVVEAIRIMEDNPIFNSGTGSWPNLAGEVEMDAVIVDGRTMRAGAVACIRKVKNPILVARKVLEETDHFLLVGEGAVKFARKMGFPEYNPLTERRKEEWSKIVRAVKEGRETEYSKYWKKISKFISADTVGAVALDSEGNIAAGTSSGGFPLKLPGRVGDVPIINFSTFASNKLCGVSLTGHGETIMKHALAKSIYEKSANLEPQSAIEVAILEVLKFERSNVLLGGIVMDKLGNVGAARTVDKMPHAYVSDVTNGQVKLNFGPIIKLEG